ncbi:MAG: hypothetical protein WB239_11410, partial [Acidimicrobiia bacterium]
PHAPEARTMAEVLYVQTGPFAWWPAHLFLLTSYVLFAVFVVGVSRVDRLPRPLTRVMRVVLPLAWVCVVAMVVHLLLPLGRDTVANSDHGWILWAKNSAETADAVWALCVAAVAWSLYRAGIGGNRFLGLLGTAGALGFGLFSLVIPLTGFMFPMSFTRLLIPLMPVISVLLTASWAIGTGLILASRHS